MRVSIITVCHRSRGKMDAYVRSFLQHHSGDEDRGKYQFVFVENSGDYEFDEVVQPLVDSGFAVVVLNSENDGFGRGCNFGARSSVGELLIFANPDIRFLCNLGCVADLPCSATWGTVRQITPSGAVYSFDLFPERKSLLFELFKLDRVVNRYPWFFLRHAYVVGSFIFVSRELFDRLGGFDPAFFLYYEEAEFARRLQAVSGPPIFCPSVSVFHEGFGSHNSRDGILKHEADGFVTYCRVTRQPGLIRRRLSVLRFLGLLSATAKRRYQILRGTEFS